MVITALTRNQVYPQGYRGFESHPVRQKQRDAQRASFSFWHGSHRVGFEQGGGEAAANSPVDCWLARGRILLSCLGKASEGRNSNRAAAKPQKHAGGMFLARGSRIHLPPPSKETAFRRFLLLIWIFGGRLRVKRRLSLRIFPINFPGGFLQRAAAL